MAQRAATTQTSTTRLAIASSHLTGVTSYSERDETELKMRYMRAHTVYTDWEAFLSPYPDPEEVAHEQ